ncbi:MAG: hypothetical protein D6705_17590 [Deltaproteobacteria bacterium]|nr:MAG: hypothetical protein D6705_17590 [Deltaproteobacteria bacterium]
MIVFCAGSKAGSGASTLAATVAAGLVERGVARHRVLLLDVGRGATLSHWAAIAGAAGQRLVTVVRPPATVRASELAEGFDHVIVDLPGLPTGGRPPIDLAPDLWLVPCRPVGPDTWHLPPRAAETDARDGFRAPVRIVPWRVPSRLDPGPWRRGVEAAGWAVAPVVVRERIAYAHAFSTGRMPTAAGDVAVRSEAAALGGYVLGWQEAHDARPQADVAPVDGATPYLH